MSQPGSFAALPLALALLSTLVGCPSDDASGEAETGTETSAGTSATTTGETDGECTPPGVFGDCGAGGEAACMTEGGPAQCVVDSQTSPSIAVCGRPCAADCDCWAAPADGDASPACESLVPGDDGTCILDCSGGLTCPTGMSCAQLPGTETSLCVFGQ